MRCALWALCAGNVENRRLCAAAGAIAPLITLVRNGAKDVIKENAAGALWRICIENNDNQAAVQEGGAVPPLVALLRGTNPQRKTRSAAFVTSRSNSQASWRS